MPKSVIVVGMPRSGTSMLAGIFGRKGFFATDEPAEQLRPGDHANPDGYWEAESLVERNVEVFEAVGYGGHNTWHFDPIDAGQARAIDDLAPIEGHREFLAGFQASAPWMWKDPRLCYTLGYWWKLMPDPGSTGVVLIRRNPEAIYRSFRRLGWRSATDEDRADLMARIEDHIGHARDAIRALDIPHIVADYEDFGSKPAETASRMGDFLELELMPSDLSFDGRYDHSTFRGRVRTAAERVALKMPGGARRALKSALPSRLMRTVFPGWNV